MRKFFSPEDVSPVAIIKVRRILRLLYGYTSYRKLKRKLPYRFQACVFKYISV